MIVLPSIALVGKQGSGKSTIAERLVTQHGFLKHSWAEPIRKLFELAYGDIKDYAATKAALFEVKLADGTVIKRTGGEILQLIGTEGIRNAVDQDFWIKAGIRRIWRPMMVNDDTRFLNETDALRAHGWVIVRVIASEELRKSRIGGAFRSSPHQSETEQDSIIEDYFIDNENRPIEEVMKELIAWMGTVDTSFEAAAERAAKR